ncbi:hypothetical protein SEVIR_9G066500v4 [Setaria viridis]|uniref:Uncharacterized protein n=1 Tax=Setaria viridis TaxID=4556 RepID=A0A4U6SSZ4_SETVI|nr:hypothetical protein SEVIR_9G066500v2 [Setaria viridis]
MNGAANMGTRGSCVLTSVARSTRIDTQKKKGETPSVDGCHLPTSRIRRPHAHLREATLDSLARCCTAGPRSTAGGSTSSVSRRKHRSSAVAAAAVVRIEASSLFHRHCLQRC